jgi:hypothetical protein
LGAAGDQLTQVAEVHRGLYGQTFATNDPQIIRKFVIVLSELFRLQLSFDEPTARLAQAFFSVLNVSVTARLSGVLVRNLETIEHFAIRILFTSRPPGTPTGRLSIVIGPTSSNVFSSTC